MQGRDLLWGEARRHWRVLAAGTGLRVVFRLLPLQVPIVAGWMIQSVTRDGGSLYPPGACLVGLAALTGLTAYGSEQMGRHADGAMTEGLGRRIWQAWQEAAPSYRLSHGVDKFQSETLPYGGALGDLMSNIAMEGIAMACRMAYPVVMLLLIDPWLALVPLSLLPAQALLGRLAARHSQRHLKQERSARQLVKRVKRETIESSESLQALGAQAAARARIEAAMETFETRRALRQRYERILSGGVWGVAALGLALSWWGGALRCQAGEMTLGQLVTFTGFAGFLGMPLRRFGALGRKAALALDRLNEVGLFLESATAARRVAVPLGNGLLGGEFRLLNVSHRFGEAKLFDRLNAVLPAGEMIWIRGRSGAGKTSLLRLLAGLEAPGEGRILMDGEELAGVRPDVMMVGREAAVFDGTIRDNLALGWEGATDEEMLWALEQVRLSGLPNGLDESGSRLATAERQRLGIAQALVRRPRALLLDEATTGLDEATEWELIEALGRLKTTMTVILVANQVRSLGPIDRVMELEGGQLTQWQSMETRGEER